MMMMKKRRRKRWRMRKTNWRKKMNIDKLSTKKHTGLMSEGYERVERRNLTPLPCCQGHHTGLSGIQSMGLTSFAGVSSHL